MTTKGKADMCFNSISALSAYWIIYVDTLRVVFCDEIVCTLRRDCRARAAWAIGHNRRG